MNWDLSLIKYMSILLPSCSLDIVIIVVVSQEAAAELSNLIPIPAVATDKQCTY